MAGELMLINPRARSGGRKYRTAAQKAATRKLVAFNRGRKRRSNPAPAHRRRSSGHSLVTRHHAVTRRRRHRNPISMGGGGGFMGLLLNGAKGGAGAVAVNLVAGLLPLPATMMTGYMPAIVRASLAVLLGTFGRKFLGNTAVKMAEGALTVQSAALIQSLLPASLTGGTPTVSGFGYGSGNYGFDYGTDTGLGYYVGNSGALPAPSPQANVGSGISQTTGEYVY